MLLCGIASFGASLVASMFHPFEVLKTRLQSTITPLMQVMMGNITAIMFLCTRDPCRPPNVSYRKKGSEGSIKASSFHSSLAPRPTPSSSLCKTTEMQLWTPEELPRRPNIPPKLVRRCDYRVSRGINIGCHNHLACLDSQDPNAAQHRTEHQRTQELHKIRQGNQSTIWTQGLL